MVQPDKSLMENKAASPGEITQRLIRAANGDLAASHEIMPLIYQSLRALAAKQLAREGATPMLSATTLVHETYAQLLQPSGREWPDRGRFFAYAAKAMRSFLIDHARARLTQKRGGNVQVNINAEDLTEADSAVRLLQLHQALLDLEVVHARAAKLIELRYFSGLSVQECAVVLEINERTARRDFEFARALIADAMSDA
jgi:RNA polymerase sigma factor (TIGR02999 family)